VASSARAIAWRGSMAYQTLRMPTSACVTSDARATCAVGQASVWAAIFWTGEDRGQQHKTAVI